MRPLLATMLLLAGAPLAGAIGEPSDPEAALATSQQAIGRQLGSYEFRDQEGRPLAFDSLRGRPVVVSVLYTSCYHVCPGLTTHLRDVVKVARQALGEASFAVVTLGFDSVNDTPERMRLYAEERRANLPGWYFASGDAASIARFTRDVGFTFEESSKGYDHITQTTLVDAQGRVVLQVYGEDFKPPVLIEPLKKLVWGQDLERISIDSLIRTVKLFCTIYDPTSGRYKFDYSLLTEIIAGVLALGMVAIGIGRAARNVR